MTAVSTSPGLQIRRIWSSDTFWNIWSSDTFWNILVVLYWRWTTFPAVSSALFIWLERGIMTWWADALRWAVYIADYLGLRVAISCMNFSSTCCWVWVLSPWSRARSTPGCEGGTSPAGLERKTSEQWQFFASGPSCQLKLRIASRWSLLLSWT